jgi:hypothetical protein
MRRLLVSLLHRAGYELGRGRAEANARGDLDELERALASVDVLAARLAARTAYGRAA